MIKQIFWRGLVFLRLTLPLVTDQLMQYVHCALNAESCQSFCSSLTRQNIFVASEENLINFSKCQLNIYVENFELFRLN